MSDAAMTPVLLVGSVPLGDEEEVFSAVGRTLGTRIRAIPDGETGDRKNWINWQKGVMEKAPMLERRQHVEGYGAVQVDLYSRKPGCDGEFPPLGYAAAALRSYKSFERLVAAGSIPPETRFMVALPTPFAPMMSFIEPGSFDAIEPLYAAAMRRELDEIMAAVPADRLAVQWDAALEFAVLEGVFPAPVRDFDPLINRMVEIASWVPAEVKLGFHLCYGDANHAHFKDPETTALMVEVMNHLATLVERPIDWFHLPVPINRDDDAYFAPLAKLAIEDATMVYLGLVHARDGLDGALRRARRARAHLTAFGIATECGFGRRPPETILPLLELQAEIARQLDRADI